MKVAVGISGGVDSSVAAFLLKEAGHELIGITMAIWDKNDKTPPSSESKNACYGPDEKQDLEEAHRICEEIGIPLHVFDCSQQYKEIVLDYFRKEYLAGRTPNPCVKCNHLMKFGVLQEMARKEGHVFDYFATGHYARIDQDQSTGRYCLKRAVDQRKDQSYFIYRLSQHQLAATLFPLGELCKEDVRRMALEHGLSVHDKDDSQDFYSGDYNDIIGAVAQPGQIVNTEGTVLGMHDGIWNYTPGQRRGLGLAAKAPLYVVRIDKESNQVVVGTKDKTLSHVLTAKDLNWVSISQLDAPREVTTKIRSSQKEKEAVATPLSDGRIAVEFRAAESAVSPGQSIVLYDHDIVLGGGIIE